MTFAGWIQIIIYFVLLLAVTKPLGLYMFKVFVGERTWLSPALRPVEAGIYRISGVDEGQEQSWLRYAVSVLLFSLAGLLVVYALQRLQADLPLNPADMPAVKEDSAFNTAASFTTNTNWQGYGGEYTMSYLTQMMALTVQNFLSAAAGIAVLLALIRGISRKRADTVGNFWVDMVRSTLYVLLPLSVVVALALVWQGVPQNLNDYTVVNGIDGFSQTIAQGPVASQVAIKQLGTNGGGFFNVNSAHPLENPNAISNFIQCFSILAIAAALTYTFGKMVGNTRQGWTLFAAMSVIFLLGTTVAYWAETQANPAIDGLGIDQAVGNMEGKEVRFGVPLSALWAVATTAASNGSVNSMHESYNALGGLIPLANIQLGEVVFGGVGSGLYGMIFFALLAVFLAGLMVGRTPEYIGKKVQSFEVRMVAIAILVLPLFILGLTGLAVVTDWGTQTLNNAGPHGYSESLYAFTSATGNNGSAFAGLGANNGFYNNALGFAMLAGRFIIIIVTLAVAGSLARKQPVPVSLGTFPTTGTLWVGLLVGVVLIVGLLTFFPALALGPIAEHFQGNEGITY